MLPERLSTYLGYFETLALQPANHWNGFYVTQYETRSFGLRFQLAFPCYAMGALYLHPEATPAEQERCRATMAALIDRMLQRRVWAYWSARSDQYQLPPDPVGTANAEYSGHLAMMLGIYRALTGDTRYDEPFDFRWSRDEVFSYTHTSLMYTLHQQMRANDHHGVESEPGEVRVTDMSHVLWANELYASVHDQDYSELNQAWLTFVEQRLILRRKRLFGNGVFNPSYTNRLRLTMPMGMSVIDAWVLAILHPLASELVAELAPRFLRTIRSIAARPDTPAPQGCVPAAAMWQSKEIADQTLANGFGYLLAVGLGHTDVAQSLLNYADAYFEPHEEEGRRCYSGGLAQPYTTALFALGEAGGLERLATLLPPAAEDTATSESATPTSHTDQPAPSDNQDETPPREHQAEA